MKSKTRQQTPASSPFAGGRGTTAAPPPGPIRLNRFLSLCGAASRRGADALIAAGRVTVDGAVVGSLGAVVDPARQRVAVDGRPLAAPRHYRYVLFHKPAGCLCTRGDPQGRPTIYDRLPPDCAALKYAGRLDADSEGLLLLTDDGALIEALTHPRAGIERTYLAWVDGPVSRHDLKPLARGVEFLGVRYNAAGVRLLREEPGGASLLELRITEGKKREVRLLCRAVGLTVTRLRRTAFGPLSLGDLAPGRTRRLTGDELSRLRQAVAPRPPITSSTITER
ncbi:MAG: rRNA pseudouridine synthase [Candidatus Edwardsbacteria bacterium]|nr:rRNA pseudouridine synthase [Candidatus Edwardsbacteria bacterium]